MEYLRKETNEDRQRYRTEILQTNSEDVKTYIFGLSKMIENCSIVTFGSQSALEAANKEIKTQLVIENAIPREPINKIE